MKEGTCLLGVVKAAFVGGVEELNKVFAAHVTDLVNAIVSAVLV